MASKYSIDSFKADEILLKHIHSHAGYNKTELPTLVKAVRRGDLDMGSFVENAIARTGKLKRVNITGMDFEDGSDSKKVTVVNQGTKLKPILGASFSTKNKKGVLRVVVVEPMTEDVYYFKIPPEFYVGVEQKYRELMLRIHFSKQGGKPDSCRNKIWDFQVKTFSKLCK